PQLQTDLAHLVLEQLAQRLDQLELHVFGQTAHVVVRLDHVRLAGGGAGGFDHIGVDRALRQPAHVFELCGFGIENVYEGVADDLALLLRIGDACEAAEEDLLRIHSYDLHAHVPGESGHNLIALVLAQQAVIDEHAGELRAYGPVQQRRDHGGVDAAGQAQQYLVAANLVAYARDAVLDDVARRPVIRAATDLVDEAVENAAALSGMGNFGVEVHAVEAALVVTYAVDGRAVGTGHDLVARRQLADPIAVAHPHIQQPPAFRTGVILYLIEQARVAMGADLRVAELLARRRLHPSAQLRRHRLHAVANPQ